MILESILIKIGKSMFPMIRLSNMYTQKHCESQLNLNLISNRYFD